MTAKIAFGEPRLDADLASIIVASEAAGAPSRPITPLFQKRAIAGAVCVLAAMLGLAEFLADPADRGADRSVVAVAPAQAPAVEPVPAPPAQAGPIELAKAAPPPVVSDRWRSAARTSSRGSTAAEAKRAQTPEPREDATFAGGSPYSNSAAQNRSAPVQRLAGPRGTVRFPDAAAAGAHERSALLRSAGKDDRADEAGKAPRGPRHIRRLRH